MEIPILGLETFARYGGESMLYDLIRDPCHLLRVHARTQENDDSDKYFAQGLERAIVYSTSFTCY
jgi:hypothetical protein